VAHEKGSQQWMQLNRVEWRWMENACSSGTGKATSANGQELGHLKWMERMRRIHNSGCNWSAWTGQCMQWVVRQVNDTLCFLMDFCAADACSCHARE
jgi:hypothetical protein